MDKLLVADDEIFTDEYLRKRLIRETEMEVVFVSDSGTLRSVCNGDTAGEFDLAIVNRRRKTADQLEAQNYLMENEITLIVLTDSYEESELSSRIADTIPIDIGDDIGYLIYTVKRLRRNIGMKVLVVEDSAMYRKIYAAILVSQLFQVYEASDGENALEIVEQNPDIRLIIADHYMPRMDGYDFVVEVRKRFSKDKTAIVVVSGTDSERIIPKFLKIGANDYLTKPFNKEELVCRINSLLDNMDLIERISEMANRDYLTKVYNRMYFMSAGQQMLTQAKRDGNNLALAMIDVDKFKSINDCFGHDTGDFVICEVARYLNASLNPQTDLVARFGGDEFCFIRRFEREDELKPFLDKLVGDIAAKGLQYGSVLIPVTLSVGVATGTQYGLEDMMKRADLQLYESKRAGRNRCTLG